MWRALKLWSVGTAQGITSTAQLGFAIAVIGSIDQRTSCVSLPVITCPLARAVELGGHYIGFVTARFRCFEFCHRGDTFVTRTTGAALFVTIATERRWDGSNT